MDKYKILIVDDEEALRTGLQTYLELEGYEVDTACSAEEALKGDLRIYSLILLDIMMDGMSGLEMAGILKKGYGTAEIPIIFLTARGSDDDMVSGLNLGADDYISKPYSIRNVLARIAAVLRRSTAKKTEGVICDRGTLVCTVDGTPLKYNRKNEMSIFQKRNEQIFSFFASFFLLLFRPLKHQLNAD